jgi:hypothetical protein
MDRNRASSIHRDPPLTSVGALEILSGASRERQAPRATRSYGPPKYLFSPFFINWASYELRCDFGSSLSAGRRRDPPPPVTARRHSWHPGLLIRPAAGLHESSRGTEVLRFAALLKHFAALRNGYFFHSMTSRAHHQAPAQSQAPTYRRRWSARFRRDNLRVRAPLSWGTRACPV